MKAINILLVIVFAATLVACEPDPYAPRSLTLCQKDATTFPDPSVPYASTACLDGGTTANVDYIPIGRQFNYWLNARVSDPTEDYRLIYYPDGWPGNGLVCLSTVPLTPDGEGRITAYQECVETDGSLPKEFDENYAYGAKIWLVLDGDVDCDAGQMIGWNPDDYLFETCLIEYTDTGAMP